LILLINPDYLKRGFKQQLLKLYFVDILCWRLIRVKSLMTQ